MSDYILPNYAPPSILYEDWERSSVYIEVRDGTKLAADIFRPVVAGKPVADPLPAIMEATPYQRATVREDGSVESSLDRPSRFTQRLGPIFRELLGHGYVVVSVDTRGHGASFGIAHAMYDSDDDRFDMYDVVQWLAAQPWSNGRIGAMGCSATGMSSWRCAVMAPPALGAVAPSSATMDSFAPFPYNSIKHLSYLGPWESLMREKDYEKPAPPVDSDPGGQLLEAALADHRRGWEDESSSVVRLMRSMPFRADIPADPNRRYQISDYYHLVPNMRTTGVAALQIGGWYDLHAGMTLLWDKNLANAGVPRRTIMGPWYHCLWFAEAPKAMANEHLRWYDHWLKGVDNGVDQEPPIRYYVLAAPAGLEWRSTSEWPPQGVSREVLYLSSKPSDTVASLFDGTLTEVAGVDASSAEYSVNYDCTTTGLKTRMNFRLAVPDDADPAEFRNMTEFDTSAVTFTTEPRSEAGEVAGFPVVTLWLETTSTDLDVFLYLELVDPDGRSELLTDGAVRMSDRATRVAPYDNYGLPWHGGFRADQVSLTPGEPAKVDVALEPVAVHVAQGWRLRLSVTNYDKDNFETPVCDPAPVVRIHFGGDMASGLSLPMMPVPNGIDDSRALVS